MSDGMRDTAAMSGLQGGIERAAIQLREAIKRARVGHRGTAIAAYSIEETINELLQETGFVVVRDPTRER